MQLDSISPNERQVLCELRLHRDVLLDQFPAGQCNDLANCFVDVQLITPCGRLFDEGTDPVDDVGSSIAFVHDAIKRLPDLLQIWRLGVQPAQTRIAIGDRRRDRLHDLMGNRGRELPHCRDAVDVCEFQLRLLECFRGTYQFSRPFRDPPFELVIELIELGLGSLERGSFDNVPVAVSPCEHELVSTDNVQDLRGPARREGVRAQHREAPIPDDLVEAILIVAKVVPILLREPGGVPGYSDSGVTFGRYLSEFLIPSARQSRAIKCATLEKPLAGRRNFYTGICEVLI